MDPFSNGQPPSISKKADEYPISGKDVLVVVISTLLILFVGFVIIGSIAAVGLMDESGEVDMDQVQEWSNGNFDSLPTSVKAAAMVTQLILIVPAWVFIRRRKLKVSTFLRINPVPVQLLSYSLLIGLGVAVIGDEISRLVDLVFPFPAEMAYGIQRMMQMDTMVDFLTMGLTVVLIAPIVEEMLFRGFFQRYFEAKRGVTSGVMVTSALFAMYHFNIYWLIPILLMATVMGAMAWRAESVMPSIIVHMTNNSLGLIAANVYGETEPEWFTLGGHVHPLILLSAAVALVYGLRKFFQLSDAKGLGGHGPGGSVGKNLNSEA
ncbi:MAG TPA: CPBP family intramembrane metalloprotease [Bacteroidetes bacterium]|nr:CAAX amino terminal protease self- immunity [bacterium BMS3Bbin04]HDO65967.1 CPBP family intramembrane metalloprotease [Bacteroidota bacterium]HEX05092.1 CPBP family intramembrane metalloprotease [Bacteroidota bacterium]